MAKWYKAVNTLPMELGSFVEHSLLPEKFKSTLGGIPILNDMLSRGWLGQGGQQLTDEGREAEAKNTGTAKTMAQVNAAATLAVLAAMGVGLGSGGVVAGSGGATGGGITGGTVGSGTGAGLPTTSYGQMGTAGLQFAPQGNLMSGGQAVGSGSLFGNAGAGLPTTSFGQMGNAGLMFAPSSNLTTSGGVPNIDQTQNYRRFNNQSQQQQQEKGIYKLQKKRYIPILSDKDKEDVLLQAYNAYLMDQSYKNYSPYINYGL